MFSTVINVLLFQSVWVLSSILSRDGEKEWNKKVFPHFKYTTEQLLKTEFPKKTSNDIYLDPCKSGEYNFFCEVSFNSMVQNVTFVD